ncbi:MAG: Crp/Fnr family transcriptional regulator [Burkholderiales bacterium]|nr:Crp/Fnr family transcriptional regulator [Burkholderiales bacterium]
MRLPDRALLFEERSPCRGFPFVLEGRVRVAKLSASGREIVLYRVHPGEGCVLTSSCLLGRLDYSARGTAEGEVLLALLARTRFDALLASHAPFREYVFRLFGERVAELMQLVKAVAFQRLDRRLAALLLGRGNPVRATHQALADELGSVREIVTRLLRHFAEEGLVSLGRERIEILDPARLRRLAAGD